MPGEFERDVTAVQSIDAVPRILEIVCAMTGMGFAAVARVTGEHWVALAVRDTIKFGLLPGGELKVETTICSEIRDAGEPVVIDHVDEDALYCGHPTPKMYGFQSYISVPIVLANGRFFGTLCAIDPQPHKVSAPQVLGTFKLFAELIAFQLDAIDSLAVSQADLLDERKTAELREQFIAVLGHDLRNPLAAVDAGARMLLRQPQNAESQNILRLMQNSFRRMSGLIDNVLDFARGRLGGGLSLQFDNSPPLPEVLTQVIAELQSINPDRLIDAQLNVDDAIGCDSRRIGQLLSNLLGNALTYSPAGSPIGVRAAVRGDEFEMSVSNSGNPIAKDRIEYLFHPFKRGQFGKKQEGLGLGLYISSEIAKAHGGTIDVTSTDAETRFVFKMPINGRTAP